MAGRDPSPVDVPIDSVGTLLFLLALTLWLRSRQASAEAPRQDQD